MCNPAPSLVLKDLCLPRDEFSAMLAGTTFKGVHSTSNT